MSDRMILEDAIAFIEGLAVVPLLMTDDIEMRLEDVQTHARIEAASLRKRLANRSTRPAEPAAPVAEAGDGEVVGWFCVDLAAGGVKGFTFSESLAKQRDGYRYLGQLAWEVYPVVRLSALEAERARADELRRERDFWENRENEALHRLAAAEQRAADALARAEKAERALETAQEERKAASEAMRHVGAHFPECAAEFDAIMDRKAARAAREAQPATDGGDNG